jgi:hypothetical protein
MPMMGSFAGLLDALGDDVRDYFTEALRAFVLDRARLHGIYRAKSIVVAVRSFVRFLGATGRCSAGMEHAIPDFLLLRSLLTILKSGQEGQRGSRDSCCHALGRFLRP